MVLLGVWFRANCVLTLLQDYLAKVLELTLVERGYFLGY